MMVLTTSSFSNGEKLHTVSLTEMHTGNATPRSIVLPLTFLVYSLAAAASKTLVPNSHKSRILAPGIHCVTKPSNVKLTILDAS
jgi:hypothetical protein